MHWIYCIVFSTIYVCFRKVVSRTFNWCLICESQQFSYVTVCKSNHSHFISNFRIIFLILHFILIYVLFCHSFYKRNFTTQHQTTMLLNIRLSQLYRSKTVHLLCQVTWWKLWFRKQQTRAEFQHQSGCLVGAESCIWLNSTPAPTLQPFLYLKTESKRRRTNVLLTNRQKTWIAQSWMR